MPRTSVPPRITGVLLSGGLNPPRMLIQLRTMSIWSHAAFLLDDGTIIEADAMTGKVVHRMGIAPPAWYKWRALYDLTPLGRLNLDKITGNALACVGKEYDWRAFLSHITGVHQDDPRKYICFELVASCMYPAWIMSKQPHELTGRDLEKSLKLYGFQRTKI